MVSCSLAVTFWGGLCDPKKGIDYFHEDSLISEVVAQSAVEGLWYCLDGGQIVM